MVVQLYTRPQQCSGVVAAERWNNTGTTKFSMAHDHAQGRHNVHTTIENVFYKTQRTHALSGRWRALAQAVEQDGVVGAARHNKRGVGQRLRGSGEMLISALLWDDDVINAMR